MLHNNCTSLFICEDECIHTDCRLTREQWAEAICVICEEPMLAGQPFYYNDDKTPEHAHCVWDKNEV